MAKKFFFITLGLCILAVLSVYYAYYKLPEEESKINDKLKTITESAEKFLKRKILVDPVLVLSGNEGDITAKLPLRHDEKTIGLLFNEFCAQFGPECSATVSQTNVQGIKNVIAEVHYGKYTCFKARFVNNAKPKIAVILDDWGYSSKNFDYLAIIKQPFTMAVLPGLKYSLKAVKLGASWKKQVILHLPMQPKRNMPVERLTIKTGMTSEQVKEILDINFESVPGVFGANNHEGSKATEDRQIMSAVMKEFALRGMFFIDSETSAASVAVEEAKKAGVLHASRDVFLDNEKYFDSIEQQLNLLAAVAKRKGSAVGIGHDHPITLEALKRYMPEIESRGFEFVYAAEIIK